MHYAKQKKTHVKYFYFVLVKVIDFLLFLVAADWITTTPVPSMFGFLHYHISLIIVPVSFTAPVPERSKNHWMPQMNK